LDDLLAVRHAYPSSRRSSGNGTAAATVTAQLIAEGDTSTNVEVVTDLTITGKPAQFATCLETKLGPDAPSVDEPEEAGDVGSGEATPEPSLSSAGSGTADELDLGATVLPILVKRYAPYAIAMVLFLFLLKRLLRSRRD
jgi:hypothetical protein